MKRGAKKKAVQRDVLGRIFCRPGYRLLLTPQAKVAAMLGSSAKASPAALLSPWPAASSIQPFFDSAGCVQTYQTATASKGAVKQTLTAIHAQSQGRSAAAPLIAATATAAPVTAAPVVVVPVVAAALLPGRPAPDATAKAMGAFQTKLSTMALRFVGGVMEAAQ